MLEIIERCFGDRMKEWGPRLETLVPTYGKSLVKDEQAFSKYHNRASEVLKLSD